MATLDDGIRWDYVQLRAFSDPYRETVALHLRAARFEDDQPRRHHYYAKPGEMVDFKGGDGHPQPFVELERDQAQRLFDDLWEQGFRPEKAEQEKGAAGAMQAHLADMRKLVFEHDVKRKT